MSTIASSRGEEEKKAREFTDYEFVEKCLQINDTQELILFLSNELNLKDYLTSLRSSILIDFQVYNIEFTKKYCFNLRQTSTFLQLICKLRDMIQEEMLLADIIAFFRERMTEYSKPLSIKEEEEWKIRQEERLKQELQKKTDITTPHKQRPSSVVKSKKKMDPEEIKKMEEEEKKRQEEEETRRRREEEIEKLKRFPIFNIDDVATITDFILTGLFQHYHLYKAILLTDQEKDVTTFKPFLETLPNFSIPLLLEKPFILQDSILECNGMELKEEKK